MDKYDEWKLDTDPRLEGEDYEETAYSWLEDICDSLDTEVRKLHQRGVETIYVNNLTRIRKDIEDVLDTYEEELKKL